jgi:hypothetical protein
MVYLVFGLSQLIFINQPSIKSLTSEGKRNTLRPMMNNELGVCGNTSKPHRSGPPSGNRFILQLISSVKRFLAYTLPKYRVSKKEWEVYRKRLITSFKTHGINIVSDSFKYFCYYRLNRYIGDISSYPIPEVLIDFAPTKSFNSFVNRKLSGPLKRRNLSFLLSLMYLKRDLNPVPKEIVDRALNKHKAVLTTLKELNPPLDFIEKYVSNIVCDKNISDEFSRKLKSKEYLFGFPLSRNSSFHQRKNDGGAQAEISLNLTTSTKGMQKNTKPNLMKFAILNSASRINDEVVNRKLIQKADETIHGSVRVCSILEPLKVRIVTAEEDFNQLVKPIQKLLWQEILKDEEFLLTRNEDIIPFLEKEFLPCSLPYYLSGDYSAATDNLNPNVIRIVLTELSQLLPTNLQNTFIKNGSLHHLFYPDGSVLDQKNGQLMGSLSSFPLLCLINKIAFEYARSLCPDGISQHCLINGDDIGFKCNLQGYNVWKEVVKNFGFDLSPGKNYLSKEVFTINSRMFILRESGTIREVPFINWALINERSSIKDVSSFGIEVKSYRGSTIKSTLGIDPTPLGSMYRTFLRQAGLCPLNICPRLRRMDRLFFVSHRSTIVKSIKEFYIPSVLGGLGALTIDEFRKTKLISKARKTQLINGFKFRLSLYALRRHINMSGPDSVNRVGCAMAEAVKPYGNLDLESPTIPIHIPSINKFEKVRDPCPSFRKFMKAIGRSDFLKTRIPDGVPNLL